MKKALLLLAIVALVAGGFGAWLRDYLVSPLNISQEGYTLVVERGSSLRGVAAQLADDRVLRTPGVFAGYGRVSGLAGRIQAGEFMLQAGDTPAQLLDMLVEGRVKLHSITIVEGWTVAELLAALTAHPAIAQTLELDSPEELSEALGLDFPHPEGLFFPDTYRFPRETTDVELLLQAHELLTARLKAAWAQREPHGVLDEPYDGLILASIIERETALQSERPQVAGVFVRRLERGMRLQTDPTVIYGLGESFDGNLTRRHLQTDSPYNTYMRSGLPPTPIALPGESALQAMAHPESGDALFFVATGRDDGSHVFSATLDEHNAAVSRYLAMLKRRGGEKLR